jgi:hypothetical protein
MKILLFFAIFILSTDYLCAQIPEIIDNLVVKYPCNYIDESDFVQLNSNKYIVDFCVEILNSKSFHSNDTLQDVIKLLESALDDSNKICFRPFLQLVDSNSTIRSSQACGIFPWSIAPIFTEYCSRKKIQFAILFFVEFVIIRKLKIKNYQVIENVKIEMTKSKAELSTTDYNMIIKQYINLLKMNEKFENSGLYNSSWRWEINIVKDE